MNFCSTVKDAVVGRWNSAKRFNNLLLADKHARSVYFENLLDMKLCSNSKDLPDCLSVGVADFRGKWEIVKGLYPNMDFGQGSFSECVDYAFVWGYDCADSNFIPLIEAVYNNAQILLCEDGFLKSADTWANFKADIKFRSGCSLILDPCGYYFDATRSSMIEQMLNDQSLTLGQADLIRANYLIKRIVGEKLTKYNHQPIFTPSIGRKGVRKVLVVDQSYGDFSIRRGWASDGTFKKMLNDALEENPDADIIVKTHPDTMTGNRSGYYQNIKEAGRVFRMTSPINPYSLLEICDKVYVCSTQFGFEALLAGKEVHTYGMPFYAGWGLTVDAQRNPRRIRQRSLAEVFYMFYIMYTRWYNPSRKEPCEIEDAIDWLLGIREEYWSRIGLCKA